MTEVVAKKSLRLHLQLAAAQLALTVLLLALLATMVFGVLPRLQEKQDDLATTQEGTRAAAVDAQVAAEGADRTLTSALAALSAPNPQTQHTRAQLAALCQQLLGTDCPPPPVATTTTVGNS